jgi:hypothetical protein
MAATRARDLRRSVSAANADGDLTCQLVLVDLVEDRVRHRWTALALCFSFLAPILTGVAVGALNTTWNRGALDATAPARQFSSFAAVATDACVAEERCLSTGAFASCSIDCHVLLSDEHAVSALEARMRNASGNATSASSHGGSVGGGSEGGTWAAVVVLMLLVVIALIGNSSHTAARHWAYVSLLASLLLVVCVPIAVAPRSPLFLAWWPLSLAVFGSYGIVVSGFWCTARGRTP